jgi:hypothetical protein
MNKKLVVIAALVFGAASFMLAQGTVKAQDNADNSADNSAVANSDSGSAATNSDTGAAMNMDNAAAPAAPAAQ